MEKDFAAAPEQHGELPEPVAKIHSDGYWTEGKSFKEPLNFASMELYTADQMYEYARAAIAAERERNPWRMAMDDALVTAHLGVATDDPYDDLNLLLDWHHDIWLDPAVSADAQALIDRGAEASAAELCTLRQQLERTRPAPLSDKQIVKVFLRAASDRAGFVTLEAGKPSAYMADIVRMVERELFEGE